MLRTWGSCRQLVQDGLVQGGTFDTVAPTLSVASWIKNFKFWSGDTVDFGGTAVDPDGHSRRRDRLDRQGATWQRASGTGDWVG